ncbi:unnamed protein product [Hydatigera taeniaeformis]|uniref:Uncharacterized protein n=1 Tax=Hydatigena taeniaeformis TaxID=6205 RepID=A0A0R3X9P4_HYDTA|nr:unnamed protein product [Hydatigera taeniaeformis]
MASDPPKASKQYALAHVSSDQPTLYISVASPCRSALATKSRFGTCIILVLFRHANTRLLRNMEEEFASLFLPYCHCASMSEVRTRVNVGILRSSPSPHLPFKLIRCWLT